MKTATKALHAISNSKRQQLRVRTVSTTATTVLAWVPPLSLAPTARNSLSHCEWGRHYQSLKLLKSWFSFPLYYSSFFRFVALNIYCQPTLMLGESYVNSSLFLPAAVQCRLHDTAMSITLLYVGPWKLFTFCCSQLYNQQSGPPTSLGASFRSSTGNGSRRSSSSDLIINSDVIYDDIDGSFHSLNEKVFSLIFAQFLFRPHSETSVKRSSSTGFLVNAHLRERVVAVVVGVGVYIWWRHHSVSGSSIGGSAHRFVVATRTQPIKTNQDEGREFASDRKVGLKTTS